MSSFGVILALWLGAGGLGAVMGLCGLGVANRRLRSEWPRAMENELVMRETATSVVAPEASVVLGAEELVATAR